MPGPIGDLPAAEDGAAEGRAWTTQDAIWPDGDGYAWLDPTAPSEPEEGGEATMRVEHRGDGWYAWPAADVVAAVRVRGLAEPS